MGTKDIAVIIDSKILISQMEIKFQEEEDKYLGSFAQQPFKVLPSSTLRSLTHSHSSADSSTLNTNIGLFWQRQIQTHYTSEVEKPLSFQTIKHYEQNSRISVILKTIYEYAQKIKSL